MWSTDICQIPERHELEVHFPAPASLDSLGRSVASSPSTIPMIPILSILTVRATAS